MAEHSPNSPPALKELAMRYAPVGLALSLLLAVSASMGQGATPDPDPRAAALIATGRTALAAGQSQAAIDSFESALVADPAYTPAYLDLAAATRAAGLQGKAIRYYRQVLEREPDNLAAIAGEGEAMLEKGAIDKARRNLARLQSLCGASCPETLALTERIRKGPALPALAADEVTPQAVVTQN